MTHYGSKQLSDWFRTVRKNTLTIAEEIPSEQYGFRAAPGTRSVGELLAHLAVTTRWPIRLQGERATFVSFESYGRNFAQEIAEEQALRTKEAIVAALREEGEKYATFLSSLDEATLAEKVGFPPPVEPTFRSRFEMLLAVKEHEMHHRGQLMLIQRMLGIVPHMTRVREAQAAQATAAKA